MKMNCTYIYTEMFVFNVPLKRFCMTRTKIHKTLDVILRSGAYVQRTV